MIFFAVFNQCLKSYTQFFICSYFARNVPTVLLQKKVTYFVTYLENIINGQFSEILTTFFDYLARTGSEDKSFIVFTFHSLLESTPHF